MNNKRLASASIEILFPSTFVIVYKHKVWFCNCWETADAITLRYHIKGLIRVPDKPYNVPCCRPFIDISKTSLKAVLVPKANVTSSVPGGFCEYN